MKSVPQKNFARDVFLYLLMVITLYFSIGSFINLLFQYINYLFPDQLNYAYGIIEGARWSISALLILFPVYIGVTWFLRKDIIKNPEKRELKVRKWLLYFTLFLAAITIIVDLVTLINNFLNGELSLPFSLKVLVVLLVAGAVFWYYFWDLRRETTKKSKPSTLLASVSLAVVLISVVSGFFIIGSPVTQRKLRFDNERINHLQIIQGEIINFWQTKERLPETLDELRNEISGFSASTDPETNNPYEYRRIGDLTFEMCASFNLSSSSESQKNRFGIGVHAPYPYGGFESQWNWEHPEGRACFARTIDPEAYPPNRALKALKGPLD